MSITNLNQLIFKQNQLTLISRLQQMHFLNTESEYFKCERFILQAPIPEDIHEEEKKEIIKNKSLALHTLLMQHKQGDIINLRDVDLRQIELSEKNPILKNSIAILFKNPVDLTGANLDGTGLIIKQKQKNHLNHDLGTPNQNKPNGFYLHDNKNKVKQSLFAASFESIALANEEKNGMEILRKPIPQRSTENEKKAIRTEKTIALRAILNLYRPEDGGTIDLSNVDLSGMDLTPNNQQVGNCFAKLSRHPLKISTQRSNLNLSGANLSKANLTGFPLAEALLTNANLSQSVLINADLSRANLHHANLQQANLSGANLHFSNLTSANLSHANLYNARLNGADLTDARLDGAIREDKTAKESGFINRMLRG